MLGLGLMTPSKAHLQTVMGFSWVKMWGATYLSRFKQWDATRTTSRPIPSLRLRAIGWWKNDFKSTFHCQS